MRRYVLLLVISLAVATFADLPDAASRAEPTPGPIQPGDLVILNGPLFDGTGVPPLDDGLVAVRGERIVAVGPRADFTVPEDAQVIDADGGFIMPGVIDSHVHLMDSVMLGFDVLTPWLQDGVTTVRDTGTCIGCVQPLRERIAAVSEDPPRWVTSGPAITSPGGYLSDGLGVVVASEDEARAVVADLLDNQGVDFIKLYDPEMPSEISRAIVEEAHARGKRVTSHPDGLVGAIAAGVDDVAHPPYSDAPRCEIPEVPDEVLQQAADAGIEMNSTLLHFPDPVLARYRDLGGVIAMGTDLPLPAAGCQLPVYELEDMVDSGLTPSEVLVASTRNAAIVSGLEAELGTLAPGKIADIIVVDGDPLSDISAMEGVSLVIKGGRLVDRTPRHTNNEFAFAQPIGPLPTDVIASFYCADREEGEPEASCVGPFFLTDPVASWLCADGEEGEPEASWLAPRTVWYRFTPEADGLVLVDLSRSLVPGFPSSAFAAAVYTGPALDSLAEVACGFGQFAFAGEAGTTYYLQVHGLGLIYISSALVHVEPTELPPGAATPGAGAAATPVPVRQLPDTGSGG